VSAEERRLGSLYDVLEFLDSLRESNEIKVWSRMLEKTAAALDAEAGVYFYHDQISHQLVSFHAIGAGSEAPAKAPVEAGDGLAGWVSKFHEPALVADAPSDNRFKTGVDSAPGVETKSVLAVPLFVNLDFVGVFEFINKAGAPTGDKPAGTGEAETAPGMFTSEDLKFVKTAIAQTSHTIRRLQLDSMVNRVTTYNSSILDNLSGGFLACDLQGRVMICNPAARQMLGIVGEATDRPVEKVLHQIPQLAGVIRRTLSSKQTVKRQDVHWELEGTPRVLGYSTLLIKDTQGQLAGAGITFQDITAHQK
jgi:PAS domain S-box-containing protein